MRTQARVAPRPRATWLPEPRPLCGDHGPLVVWRVQRLSGCDLAGVVEPVTPEQAETFTRAQRRVEWSALALSSAADDLQAVGEHGAVINGTVAQQRICAGRARQAEF
jgi:hypothetical protein